MTFDDRAEGARIGLGLEEKDGQVVVSAHQPGSLSAQGVNRAHTPNGARVVWIHGNGEATIQVGGRPLKEVADLMRAAKRPMTIGFGVPKRHTEQDVI